MMRPSTERKAIQAAVLTFAGVPRREIAERLGVNEVRVKRLLTTGPAQEMTRELRLRLADEVVKWRSEQFDKKVGGRIPPNAESFYRKVQADAAGIGALLEKYGGRRGKE